MPEHIFKKEEIISLMDGVLGKTLEQVDQTGFFNRMKYFALQKGVVGSFIEQSVLGYDADCKQEADLIVIDGNEKDRTELKTTGMRVETIPSKHYVAKEPMSITGVGVYELAEQSFETSHFWEKLEKMLIVYYLYDSNHPVSPFEYKDFPIIGYEFHVFDETEKEALRADWNHVWNLVSDIVKKYPGKHDKEWRENVKKEYIERHGFLRRVMSYVDLAPLFPPRFRLKKTIVSHMIAKHFGYSLEQLPGRYVTVSDIDKKCDELTRRFKGKSIGELSVELDFSIAKDNGTEPKNLAESIIISMFGGKAKKLNQIELFERFGIIAKSIVLTSKGKRTEDMKLFKVDFDEVTRQKIEDEDGVEREIGFEDSEFYSYFADHELLCIIFQEPENNTMLSENVFVGFKRLVFSEEFINGPVRLLWEDIRTKVLGKTLIDVTIKDKNGNPKINKTGSISSAPNFLKSSDNMVFLRGSGVDSSFIHKTESVNGIQMLPQYVWIRGAAVVKEL